MTFSRPMFPRVDATRRRFLTVAAGASVVSVGGLAVAAVAPSLAVPAVLSDPAFALIADKRAADVALEAALDAYNEVERQYGVGSDAVEEFFYSCTAGATVNKIDRRLARTPPTTLAGIAAVLRFANEIEDAGLEWPDTDAIGPEGWHYQLRATMAAALEALINVPAGKAVQS